MGYPQKDEESPLLTRLIDVIGNAYWRQRRLFSLVHFVTLRCDARCPHCFVDFGALPKSPLNIAEIERMAERLGGALVNVSLTGGEPFLNRELWPICRAYLERARVDAVSITTHGGYPERIEALLKSFVATRSAQSLFFSISVDNLPEGHDRNRRVDGLFSRALESYARVMGCGDDRVGAGISITVAEHNHERVLELYDLLRQKHGVEVIAATLRREQGVAPTVEPAVRQKIARAYAALTRQIQADRARTPRRGARRLLVARVQDAKDDVLYRLLRKDGALGARYRTACPAGGLFAVLYPAGEVFGCEIRSSEPLGNLREHGLDMRALLEGKTAREWRRLILRQRCHCTYECALGINIASHLRYLPDLTLGLARSFLHD